MSASIMLIVKQILQEKIEQIRELDHASHAQTVLLSDALVQIGKNYTKIYGICDAAIQGIENLKTTAPQDELTKLDGIIAEINTWKDKRAADEESVRTTLEQKIVEGFGPRAGKILTVIRGQQ